MLSAFATPLFLSFISSFIVKKRDANVLDIGAGLTTLFIASVLEAHGSLISFESRADHVETVQSWLKNANLNPHVVRHCPLKPCAIDGYKWYDFNGIDIPLLDLLVIDGPYAVGEYNTARYPALPLLRSGIHQGTIILLDDANRSGERKCVEMWKQEFDLNVVIDERWKGTAIIKLARH